jgi:hypothetical protein
VRGASALQEVLSDLETSRLRAFVVWEPVLFTDVAPPTTSVLSRITDSRAVQYYDRSRLLSRLLVKTAKDHPGYLPGIDGMADGTILWDCLLVFPAGERWEEAPPRPDFLGSTVVGEITSIRRRLSSVAPAPSPSGS